MSPPRASCSVRHGDGQVESCRSRGRPRGPASRQAPGRRPREAWRAAANVFPCPPSYETDPEVRTTSKVMSRSIACGMPTEAHRPRTGGAAHVYDERVTRVRELALETSVQPLKGDGGGEDGGQAVEVAVVDDLEEFLLGPRRAVVRADVVQNEHGDVLDLLEHLVMGELRVVRIAAPGAGRGGQGRR